MKQQGLRRREAPAARTQALAAGPHVLRARRPASSPRKELRPRPASSVPAPGCTHELPGDHVRPRGRLRTRGRGLFPGHTVTSKMGPSLPGSQPGLSKPPLALRNGDPPTLSSRKGDVRPRRRGSSGRNRLRGADDPRQSQGAWHQ